MICRLGLNGRVKMMLRFGITEVSFTPRRLTTRVMEKGLGTGPSALVKSRFMILRAHRRVRRLLLGWGRGK
ncbi:hypothetical protein FOTG_19101 [Fusarium oxysporum f. sp. vasinfectum 25433]|uniref:Uncharacterized protein n=1 Tax=Fusarium oxysporum f. sp. vasinfectum 25433 TaxID=1089449 RepID=X0KFX2_FUSOX|nr:hypothetical protein FOTG_19101 [Fusarium oxysporum f. sp. vasinfectum 25433]